MISVRLLAPLAALALLVAGCGDDKDSGSAASGTNSATTPTVDTATLTTDEPQATTGEAPAVSNAKDLSSKPIIAMPAGDPPTELIKKDLVVGKGEAVKKGDIASMQYVGISYSNGKEFDASWDRGQPFQFPLGGGQVITGWDEGIPGMKVGGRRILVIPPDQGYGPAGSPPTIAPNETLVFVVDLVGIG